MSKILLVEDELGIRQMFQVWMKKFPEHELEVASDGKEGIEKVEQTEFDVVFSDLRMPGGVGGIEILSRVRELWPATQVIIITAHATAETAIQAMTLGAYTYIKKPFLIKELETHLHKCLEKRALLKENVHLRNELHSLYNFGNLIGRSPAMLGVIDRLRKVIDSKANVLILGENGTGKELVTRALHYNGPRRNGSFVPINCGAITENLWESEFFGYERGAFTGAEHSKPGYFEQADGGSLFLDEIGEMPLHMQVKLLRVLQEQQVRPVGSTKSINVDVRIIAATNKELEKEVQEGRFREDLFFRLNVFSIRIPPLRERKEDLPLLAQHFLEQFATEYGRDIQGFAPLTMERLRHYSFPGNIRELKNIIEQSVLLESSSWLQPESLPPQTLNIPVSSTSTLSELRLPEEGLEAFLEDVEKELLMLAMQKAQFVKKEAARLLKIKYRSFRHRLAKYKDLWDED